MYQQLKSNEKIDLLLISIESLTLYQYNSLTYSQYHLNLWKHIFCLKHNNYLRDVNIQYYEDYEKKIKVIQSIYKLIHKLHLKKCLTHILESYCNNYNSIILLQYLRRYKYLYQKTQSYYNIKSHYNNINIEETAIINLYIIHQIYQKQGLYFLIKYLYGHSVNI